MVSLLLSQSYTIAAEPEKRSRRIWVNASRCQRSNSEGCVLEVKLTFEMLTVRGQQHSFSTHERMFLWKCQSFWDRKCLDLRGTRSRAPTIGFMPNSSTIWATRARHLLSHVLEYWLWWYRYFLIILKDMGKVYWCRTTANSNKVRTLCTILGMYSVCVP